MTTTSTEKPFGWIKHVERILLDLEERPQFGLPADFNWEEFEKKLQSLLDRPSLRVEHTVKGWVAANQVWEGLGESLHPLAIESPPLRSPAYFAASEHDLKRLMAALLGGEKEASYFYDPSLVQGFYHYFVVEILQILGELPFAYPLAPRLSEAHVAIKEPCFVIDVALTSNGHSFWGRVLFPESFRIDWKRYFANRPPPSFSEDIQQKISVDVSLEVGSTQLSFDEWSHASEGDFILLDRCSYDPAEKRGGVVLTVDQKPLFRGRFKEEGIKLTEYPIYEEVSVSMEKRPFTDDEPEEQGEPSDLDEDELPDEEEFAERTAPSISAEDLPIQLTVEVGRVRMSAKELLNLAPGNLLKVNVLPEQGVDLLINGKKVGRGELIRLGDTLGVRILSL